jgi:hypothetical protein
MKRAIIVAIVILFIMAGQAVCDTTGGELLPQCKDVVLDKTTKDSYKVTALAGFCVGFINGVWSTSEVYRAVFKGPRLFCLPTGIDDIQLVKVVVKYLGNHSEQLHYEASSQVLAALKDAFPCNEKP